MLNPMTRCINDRSWARIRLRGFRSGHFKPQKEDPEIRSLQKRSAPRLLQGQVPEPAKGDYIQPEVNFLANLGDTTLIFVSVNPTIMRGRRKEESGAGMKPAAWDRIMAQRGPRPDHGGTWVVMDGEGTRIVGVDRGRSSQNVSHSSREPVSLA